MTEKRSGSRKTLISVTGLILLATLAAATFVYRAEQQRRTDDVLVLINEGMAQFRQEQYELSLKTLGSIPEDLNKDWHAPYYMGSALIKLKDYQSGAVQLEKALALKSDETNVLFALGVVYYKLGNLSLSKAYFASVLEVDPGHEEAKGLMDIMANLERQQPGATPEDRVQTNGDGDDSH